MGLAESVQATDPRPAQFGAATFLIASFCAAMLPGIAIGQAALGDPAEPEEAFLTAHCANVITGID